LPRNNGLRCGPKLARVGAIASLLAVAKPGAAQLATQLPAAAPLSGEQLFIQQCGTCHSVVKGEGERAGPSLYAVAGRAAGKLPGFDYSPALENSTLQSTISVPIG
jgi:cytochrome c2